MEHVITVGDILIPALIIAGSLGAIALGVAILAVIGDAWKH